MEFKYVLDPNADTPIMLINKHIGMDDEDGEGIIGEDFTRELMFLDSLNKKKIDIWINSGGGVVTEGEKIIFAILNCKTPVDTICTGTAASIAGPIFTAGRNRYMMDYAKLMMHPVSGGDEKSTKAFEQSIRTMLSSRSFLTEDHVQKLMDRTSWIFPKECIEMGLATEIIVSHGVNTNGIDPKTATYKDYSKIVNKLIENKKPQTMSSIKVTNRLKLVDGSNDEAIVASIDAIENNYKSIIAENKSKFDKYVDEMAEAKKAKDESDARYNSLKAKYDEMEEKAKNELAASNKARAVEFVKNKLSLGLIKDDAETIAEYEKMGEENFERLEKLLNGLTVSKIAPKVIIKNSADAGKYTAMDINNELMAKNKHRFS